jgi:NADH-quinone oxidoreductase subunit L
MYEWKKISPDNLANKLKKLYNGSLNKWFIDEIYDATFISGTLSLSGILSWFDKYIVDGIVNGTASVTQIFSKLSGLFDTYIVDGIVNGTAFFSGSIGFALRKLQTGKVQTYIVLVLFSIIALFYFIGPF